MVFFSPFFRVNLTYLRIEIDEKSAQYIIDGYYALLNRFYEGEIRDLTEITWNFPTRPTAIRRCI